MDPYVKQLKGGSTIWVCPSHPLRGFAPTNFTDGNAPPGQIPQTPGVQDVQAARMSYICNELFMPRKKYAAVPQMVVPLAMSRHPRARSWWPRSPTCWEP